MVHPLKSSLLDERLTTKSSTSDTGGATDTFTPVSSHLCRTVFCLYEE